MFDILADTALDIANGMLNDAWGGKAPAGGLDFPSACVLSRSSDIASDVHVDIGLVHDTEQLSALPWLADVTHTEVQGPADTDSPFRYQAGEITPPGMFGKALKAYGQVCAIATEYGVDVKGYDSWFREQWGVPEDADLTMAVPMLRSHGDALWGGINRKLSPYASAHSAASKQVRVTWHGGNRQDMGEHKLVSWPRLSAIARVAGGALMVEDRHAKGRLNRIDFRVVKGELPVAPSGIGQNLARIPVRSGWETRSISRDALEFITGFRAVALQLARGGLGDTGVLSLDDSIEIPATALLAYLKEAAVPGIPRVDFLAMGEAVFDIEVERAGPSVKPGEGQEMNVYNAFAAVTRPYIDKNSPDIPPAHILRRALHVVQEDPAATDAAKIIRDTIATCIPDDFLLRMYRLYTIVNKSKEKGEDIIVAVLKTFDAPRSAFETRDWVAVGRRVKNAIKCRDWFCEELARGISRYRLEHGEQAPIVGKLRRILSSEGTGDIALAEIIRQRRNWWAHEYRRRAKFEEDRRVEFQVKAKLFRHTQIEVSASGNVVCNESSPALVSALGASARAFMRKRKGFNAVDPEAPDPGRMGLGQYAQYLDDMLHPSYSYVDGVFSYRKSVEFLVDDVVRVVKYIAENMPSGDMPPGGDLDYDSDIESIGEEASVPAMLDFGDDDESDDDDDDEVPKASGALFGDDDEDDSDDDSDYNPYAGMLKLADELKEDLPHLTFDEIVTAISTHGEYVKASDYKPIMNEAHKLHLSSRAAGNTNTEYDGHDVSDTRHA